jgi:REP element-mobilizing transposase RayT
VPFWRTYYHVVWTTKERRPQIAGEVEQGLFGAIAAAAQRAGAQVHAVNGTADHVHVVVSVPPVVALATLIGQMKGASAHLANRYLAAAGTDAGSPFAWGRGYGLFTLGPRQLSHAVAYVKGQKAHHAQSTTNAALERASEE